MSAEIIEKQKDKLLPVEAVRDTLAQSEPISIHEFPVGDSVKFRVGAGWNSGLDAIEDTDVVDADVTIGEALHSRIFKLTKDALFEATSLAHLPKGSAMLQPDFILNHYLNHWYREGLGDKSFNLLAVGEASIGSAMTRSTVVPFSNLRLMDKVLEVIHGKYGDVEILADHKFEHTLQGTLLRLIIPQHNVSIEGTDASDDTWSIGLQIRNSLTGVLKTEINGYLFRWADTSGAIDPMATTGVWNRRKQGQNVDDVYDWAGSESSDVLTTIEKSLSQIQEMVSVKLDSNQLSVVLKKAYKDHKITVPHRTNIDGKAELIPKSELNMYSVMTTITEAANEPEILPGHVEQLMALGGDMIHRSHKFCTNCKQVIEE